MNYGAITQEATKNVKDHYNIVYWSVFFMGMSIYFPWNTLTTVTSYWNFKLRNVTYDNKSLNITQDEGTLTELQKMYNSYLSIASMVPNAVVIILHALLGHKIDIRLRLYGAQIVVIGTLGLITIFTCIDSDDWQEVFLYINLVIIAFYNIFVAVFKGGVAAILGSFPEKYLGTMSSGSAMGGLIPSLLNVAIIGVSENSAQTVGFICFLICTLVSITCFIVSFLIKRNEYFQHHGGALFHKKVISEHKNNSSESIDSLGGWKFHIVIIKKSWIYLLTLLINFSTTLTVFPAVVALVKPTSLESESQWEQLYFVPLFCFLLYNVGDYIGKEAATRLQWPKDINAGRYTLLVMAALRTAFIPFFMYCNIAPSNRTKEVIFESNWWYITFITFFSLTNGYVGNIAFMSTPKTVSTEYQSIAASYGAAMVVCGLALGSLLSTPVVNAL